MEKPDELMDAICFPWSDFLEAINESDYEEIKNEFADLFEDAA